MFKEDIDPIKQRVYGTVEKINEDKKALLLKLEAFQNTHATALAGQCMILAGQLLLTVMKPQHC